MRKTQFIVHSWHFARRAICDTKKAVASHNLLRFGSVRCLSLWLCGAIVVSMQCMRLIVTNSHNELFTFPIHLHAFTLLMPRDTFPFVQLNAVVCTYFRNRGRQFDCLLLKLWNFIERRRTSSIHTTSTERIKFAFIVAGTTACMPWQKQCKRLVVK